MFKNFTKNKKNTVEQPEADLYLIEKIQPQGGILFKHEKYIKTGSSYECCLHVYEFPEKVHDNWIKELTDIKDTVVTIDISSEDTYEIKKNINRSLKEQTSRRINASNWEEAYDAAQREKEMQLLFHEISQMKEIIKIVDIRIFLSDRQLDKLEEKLAKLMKILEANGYRSTIFLNETRNEWVSMYQNYTTQQENNQYAIYGQPVQSRTLAFGNPFHFSSLEDPYGAYMGYTRCGGNILFDEFTKTKTRLHYNSVVIGTMGSGKSTLLKKRFQDRAARGDFVRIFDITGEFARLTKHEGGKIIRFDGTQRLNPFEILKAGDNETINFQLHNSKLSTDYKFLIPNATEQEVITFSNLVRDLYKEFGLHPESNNKEIQITGLPPERYPTFSDFLELLNRQIEEISSGDYNETTIEVARRKLITLDNIKNAIEYVIYTFGSILDGYTTIENILDEPIVCFDISALKDMKSEIFDMLTFNMLTLCWDNCVTNGQRMNRMEDLGQIEKRDKIKTLIIIDEAHRWVNAKKEHALDLITTYLREARKYNGGIILASQSIRDFVPEGSHDTAINKIKTIFELTQYKFIFHQDSNSITMLNDIFQHVLTQTQINKIPKLELGDNILCISGDKNYEFHVHITEEEQRLFAGGD